MGVGGLLHVGVIPLLGVQVVRPDQHILQEVVRVGVPVQGPVDQGHRLGPGDVLVRPEGPVRVPLDKAVFRGLVDVILGPVAVDVREEVLPLVVHVEEPGGNHRELGPGDIPVGVKGPVGIAADDPAVGQGGDGVVEPVRQRHIRVAAVLAPEVVPALIGEHAEVDGGHLRPGDVALGLHRLFGLVLGGQPGVVVHGVADDVAIVVLGVQAGLVVIGVRIGAVASGASMIGKDDLVCWFPILLNAPITNGKSLLSIISHRYRKRVNTGVILDTV